MKITNLPAVLLAFFLYISAFAQGNDYIANQLIVKIKGKHSISLESDKITFGLKEFDILNSKHQLKKAEALHNIKGNRSFLLEFQNDTDISDLIKKYESSGLFEYIEPNYIVHATGYRTHSEESPNDTHYSRQWAFKNDGTFRAGGANAVAGADIKMEPAWEIEKGSSSIIVAVLDTGINFVHPEFEGRIWENPNAEVDDGYELDLFGWNFISNDNTVFDDQGHGTAVAGVIAAKPNNNLGFAGVDWHCYIMTVKVLNDEGSGSVAGIVQGVHYATDRGANVINMSLGGPNYSNAFNDAIEYAYSNNVTVFAAMGNENTSEISYPAGYLNAIAVGSTNPNDRRSDAFNGNPSDGSNYGGHIDVVAPGAYIYVLDYYNENNYGNMSSGTSLATPYAAGLASLLLAQDPTRTPDDIRQIIRSTADDQVGRMNEDTEGFDIYHGYGRINAFSALSQTLSISDMEKDKIVIFPNPASEHFYVQNNDFSKLQVFSIDGRLLLSKTIAEENEITQDVSDWKPGAYIIKLDNKKGQSSVEKLIVK